MSTAELDPARITGGYAVWRGGGAGVEVRFAGRGPAGDRSEVLRRILAPEARRPGGEPGVAWARQVHSSRVLRARPGACGEGDALVSDESGLALSVATADCVPVLLASRRRIAAIHAGWRGIAAGIVPAALEELSYPADEIIAWLGPAIGPCCYEVGAEVAAAVVAAAGSGVASPGRRAPHLDLRGAVARQLAAAGARNTRLIGGCTRCSPEQLWSYRREGREAGRNLAFIWREE